MSNHEDETERNKKRGAEEEEAGREKRRKLSGFTPSFEKSMESEKTGGRNTSKISPSFVEVGDRKRFSVDLLPGEPNIVSWRKLVKDASNLNGTTSRIDLLPSTTQPALDLLVVQGQASEKELKDEPPPNRFGAVIEKIERLYMGEDSSDEEDLNNFPDDNQYDTEDSFIDDVELDEYFEVDNSAIRHNGFFVNRGKLERINETKSPNQQVKRRKTVNIIKSRPKNDGYGPNKQSVLAKKTAGRSVESDIKYGKNPSQSVVLKATQIDNRVVPRKKKSTHMRAELDHSPSLKVSNGDASVSIAERGKAIDNSMLFPSHPPKNCKVVSTKRKSTDMKTVVNPSSLKVLNGDASASIEGAKDIVKKKVGVLEFNSPSYTSKDARAFLDDSHEMCHYHDQSSHTHMKSQAVKQVSSADKEEQEVRSKEKNALSELPDLNIPEVKQPIQTTVIQQSHRKDGSSAKTRSAMLENTLRELEKMVAESRPQNMELQNGESQAVKRRLPHEVRQKLAKVARLAVSTHGKISEELTSRLMSILGHLIQLRTLKRNMKIMVNMSLSAKQEKDKRFQDIKKDVVDMIKLQFPSLKSRSSEPLTGASDDFQETPPEGKVSIKSKPRMGSEMEDKICDLYDIFVDGLDEDGGSHIRKLYAELAKLWPNGLMDNHGIKRGICRAKARKKTLESRKQDVEKNDNNKKKAVEGGSVPQPQCSHDPTTHTHGVAPLNPNPNHSPNQNPDCSPNPNSNPSRPIALALACRMPNSPSISSRHCFERLRSDKIGGVQKARVGSDIRLIRRKLKKKPEMETGSDIQTRPQPSSNPN